MSGLVLQGNQEVHAGDDIRRQNRFFWLVEEMDLKVWKEAVLVQVAGIKRGKEVRKWEKRTMGLTKHAVIF
jgi:hypothetical protein